MISVIVPIYKVENYIRKCIESILNQSYRDIEVILVDDGSIDSCPEICDEYAKKDSRVKVIHKTNGGLMSARQAGVQAATGDYVGFVDGDDWLQTDMYEKVFGAISKYAPDMVVCEFFNAFENKKEVSSQILKKPFYVKQELEKEIYPKMLYSGRYYDFGIFPCCWAKVYKKELLKKHLLTVTTKIKMGEDAAFTYPCLLDSSTVCYIDEPLYNYRITSQSMSNAYDSDLENTILIPYEILKSCFEKYRNKSLDYQLDNYLFYLLNIILRNESSRENKKGATGTIKTLKGFASNSDIENMLKTSDFSSLPIRKKIIAKFFKYKEVHILYLYCLLLRKL